MTVIAIVTLSLPRRWGEGESVRYCVVGTPGNWWIEGEGGKVLLPHVVRENAALTDGVVRILDALKQTLLEESDVFVLRELRAFVQESEE